MNNQELIRMLDRDQMLSVIELLSSSLIYEDWDWDTLVGDMYSISLHASDYCRGLTDYERLKVMQLIINTLIGEAEQSAQKHFQTLLPLKAEEFYRP